MLVSEKNIFDFGLGGPSGKILADFWPVSAANQNFKFQKHGIFCYFGEFWEIFFSKLDFRPKSPKNH